MLCMPSTLHTLIYYPINSGIGPSPIHTHTHTPHTHVHIHTHTHTHTHKHTHVCTSLQTSINGDFCLLWTLFSCHQRQLQQLERIKRCDILYRVLPHKSLVSRTSPTKRIRCWLHISSYYQDGGCIKIIFYSYDRPLVCV